ncbi:hypothetical protein AHAS_Ahas10G0062200 [Arachis hypogaea]
MTALLAKPTSLALVKHPVVNSSCRDGNSFTYNSNINIAVAIAIEGGLITLVLQDADKVDVYTLSRKWKELVDKARAKQLQPHEIEELTSDCVKVKEFNDALQIDLSKQIELSVNFKKNSMDKVVDNGIANLKHHHSQYKEHIINLLNDGESSVKSIINVIDERVRSFDQSTVPYLILQRDG